MTTAKRDTEEELDEALSDAVQRTGASIRLWRSEPDATTLARVRRRRRASMTAMVSACAASVLVVGVSIATLLPLAAREGSPISPGAGSVSPSPSPTSSVHESSTGMEITLPVGWTFVDGSSTEIVSPRIDLMFGNWDFPTGGSCGPGPAVSNLPSDGVLAWIYEYLAPDKTSDFAPRPQSFSLGRELGPFECIGSTAHVLMFTDSGRYVQVMVVTGQNASSASLKEMESALDSLVIAPS